MYCPSCGEEIHGDSKYCPACGTEIRGRIAGEDEIEAGTEEGIEEDTEAGTEQSDNVWNSKWVRRVGKGFAYLVGALLILAGIGGLGESVVAGVVLLVGGIVSLPIFRAKLKQSQDIALGWWKPVVIVFVLIVAGGMLAGDTGDTPGTGTDGANPTTTPTTTPRQAIQKPATELVVQLDQLEVGWSGGVDGNETYAEGRFFQSEEDAVLQTRAEKFDTVESGVDEYAERVAEIEERHATESVDVGDEGILYITSNTAWILFRDANVIAEVRYSHGYSTDRAERVKEFANKMHENFPE